MLTICAELASARRFAGACSVRNTAEPWNSPPVEKPCSMRASSSSTGAAMPMVAKGGVIATIRLPTPIRMMVSDSIRRRP